MKKGILAFVVVLVMIVGLVPSVAFGVVPPYGMVWAVRSAHTVNVDGAPVDITAFNIGGHNFFMLRDVAVILRGSLAQFNVAWDETRSAIMLTRGVSYNPTGGAGQIAGENATASPSTAVVYVDGNRVNLRAYNISGHNYFMLQDLGNALDFAVYWDAIESAVLIYTAPQIPATPETPTTVAPTPIPTTERTPEPTPEPDVTPEPTPSPSPAPSPSPTPAPPVATGERVSAAQFVRNIGPGWNLGNQFDAHHERQLGFSWLGGGNYANTSVAAMEVAWQNSRNTNVVTREFLETLRDTGFTAIRIPVTWYKVAPGPEHIIREDWMARIYEVVGWAYELDMHIILNTHHENNFYTHADIHAIGLLNHEVEYSIQILQIWWEQIAAQFEGFGERLMFAGLNEPRSPQQEWTGGTPEARGNLNRLNQAFVDTVRASGGNNADRFLLVPTHAASASNRAFDGFTIPNDPADDRILLAVHTYSPFQWAHDGQGNYAGPSAIRTDLRRVADHAQRLGVPVVLSEWGSVNNSQPGNLEQREQHAYDYVSIARELGMATFWWDNNIYSGNRTHGFGLLDRATGNLHFPTIIDAIMRAMS
ncbi:MAG: cellulase family glycosylhydrolase [Defluviitaleaceae bacterium]|nr:cellulase family glycosylhydrolase [Defluviitaleaceae bacterium]MCL2263452.1 cellulase family glycosylhydrolase [Defluviitaleaceae bacterium]